MSDVNTGDRENGVARLCWILQALASPGDLQVALFPEFVVLGDELALEFDNWYQVVRENRYDTTFPPDACKALERIDAAFDRMVDAHEHVWSATGVKEAKEWADIRALAAAALTSLGWPREGPGPSPNTYVPA